MELKRDGLAPIWEALSDPGRPDEGTRNLPI